MLLLAALSAATLAVLVRAALLPSEIKTNKNESEALANALRNKLMSENYDYMPPESGEPSHSAASYEEQEPMAVHARAHDLSGTRERYENQKQESSKNIPETYNGLDDNLVEMQRALPVPGNMAHDPNVMMRHDNPKVSRNGDDYIGKQKISWHFDGTMKMKPGGYNERDERYLDKESNKYKLKQIQNDDKRAKSQYNDLGNDNPPKRQERHHDFKYINQEPDKPAKIIQHTENDRIDKEAEMRRDKIDKYKYDKHNDDQRLDGTDDRQTVFDNMEERHGKQNRPGDNRYDEVSELKNSKTSDFIQSEWNKRIDMRFGMNVDSRYNNLEAFKAAKREQDKKNDFRFDKSDHRQPDNLLYDKKNNFRKGEREKFQLNSHENDRLHDLSGDNRENIRSDEENNNDNNKQYKSRFQKLNNVRPDDLRQNNPDKLTRDKMRQEKSDKFKYDKHNVVKQENNKNNQLKQDDPDKIKYGIRYDQKHSDNRHDKRNKLNVYDRDVFPQANNKSSKSNLKYNKYDGLRQDELRYDKIRHTKRDEMRKDEMKYDKANKRDDSRHEKTNEIRHNDKEKQNLHIKNPKEKKNKHETYEETDELRHYDKKKQNFHITNHKDENNKHEPCVNDNKQEKSIHHPTINHKQEIMKMGREHEQIKEKKLRQDYEVNDDYNKNEDDSRQISKQKLDKPRNKPNENSRDKPRDLMHSKLNTKLTEVPLKYDKLEQQLEKQFQRINPITESDKENNKYKNNGKNENQYIKDRYDKYKHINNEYKYKHKEINENDISNRYRSNSRYNKGRPYHPQPRARVVTSHPSEEYIAEHGNIKYASVTNCINSVYVPRSRRDMDKNINVTADHVSGDDNFEQKVPGVSQRDLLYYVDDKKLAGLMGTDDIVDVADVPAVDTQRVTKKYKMLKTMRSGRRAGEAGRVVQEEGAGGVALVALDGGALPSFQLPRARRQYMPSDHDSDYQAGDLLDDIPGLKEYPEPDLARMDLNLLSPPGLTASVQSSYNHLYSPSVNGPIVPEKEWGDGRALFDAMNVKSILNE